MYSKITGRKAVLSVSVLLASLACGGLFAAPSVSALARVYDTTDHSIKIGMVVAAAPTPKNSAAQMVAKANQSNANLAVGIVTDSNLPELVFKPAQTGSLVVTDSGQVQAYVSNINGTPQVGDLLVPSPLNGILMRASLGTKGVIAAMVGKFPAKAETYKLKQGETAKIASVSVDLDIHGADQPQSAEGLEKFASELVGHTVSTVQALAAIIVVILTLGVTTVISYGAIASFLIAIGRNPMASGKLRGGLVQVLGLALAALIGGAVACWAVLWL